MKRNMRQAVLAAAAYRMGCKATVRALAGELARRDRELAELRAQFDRDIAELRALLNQAGERFFYLQKLDVAMRETPSSGVLH
jgi:hypothetical protein